VDAQKPPFIPPGISNPSHNRYAKKPEKEKLPDEAKKKDTFLLKLGMNISEEDENLEIVVPKSIEKDEKVKKKIQLKISIIKYHDTEKIVIIDACSELEEHTLTGKILNAFEQISATQVGAQLLKDILLNCESTHPLVIVPTGLLAIFLGEQNEKDLKRTLECSKNCLDFCREIGKTIKEIPSKNLNSYLVFYEIDAYFGDSLREALNFPAFVPSTGRGDCLKYNTIYIGDSCCQKVLQCKISDLNKREEDFHKIGSKNDFLVPMEYSENEIVSLDITLFHELNHYRHFMQRKKTFHDDGSFINGLSGDNNTFYASTRGASIKELVKRSEQYKDILPIMTIPEEELQLVGYTQFPEKKQTQEIKDCINEMRYRIQSRATYVRYPYSCSNIKNTNTYFILLSFLLKLLYESLCDTSKDIVNRKYGSKITETGSYLDSVARCSHLE
jgi:hypothetical protein